MPGFPDKFMPFMDEPPGGKVSTAASVAYGAVVRTLRKFTQGTLNKEPSWRTPTPALKSGSKGR
jgi:hydrogenase small subunit